MKWKKLIKTEVREVAPGIGVVMFPVDIDASDNPKGVRTKMMTFVEWKESQNYKFPEFLISS